MSDVLADGTDGMIGVGLADVMLDVSVGMMSGVMFGVSADMLVQESVNDLAAVMTPAEFTLPSP